MKTLVLVLSLVATSAFAGTDFEAMSWASILTSGKYDVDYSNKIEFQKAGVWVASFSNTLCTDGDFIYGGTRVIELTNDKGDVVGTKKVDLVQPIVSERTVCGGKDENAACTTRVYNQSPNRMIKVLAAGTGNGENKSAVVLGAKSYTIPACGDLEPVPAN